MAKLVKELKKKRGFDSPEQEATLGILRTSDQFENRMGRLFREYGLTPSQYNVLRILRGEGQPLPSLEIAERMIQVVPAITGLIDRLEKQELVARRRCTRDRPGPRRPPSRAHCLPKVSRSWFFPPSNGREDPMRNKLPHLAIAIATTVGMLSSLSPAFVIEGGWLSR